MAEWRAIPGWEGLYEINRIGEVRRTPRIVKPSDKDGYQRVWLSDGKGRTQTIYVHRLVCHLFNGPAPSLAHEVAHNDGNRWNAHAANLRWATRLENMSDKVAHGTQPMGADIWNARLTEEQAQHILVSPDGHSELARRFGVGRETVRCVRSGKSWKHLRRAG